MNGPTNSGNGALDYNDICEISGGVLIAAGSSGIAEPPSDSSSQRILAVYFNSVQAEGTLTSLLDEQGNVIVSFTPVKEYQSIIISSPEIQNGAIYTLISGGTNSGSGIEGYYSDGNVSGAVTLTDITVSSVITSISDDGTAVTGGMGGKGGMGGGHPGDHNVTPPEFKSDATN